MTNTSRRDRTMSQFQSARPRNQRQPTSSMVVAATAAASALWAAPAARDGEVPAVAAPHRRWLRLLENRSAVLGGAILIGYLFLAIFGELIAPYPPLEFHYHDTL